MMVGRMSPEENCLENPSQHTEENGEARSKGGSDQSQQFMMHHILLAISLSKSGSRLSLASL